MFAESDNKTENQMQDKTNHNNAEQGDINTTANRQLYQQRNISSETRQWLEKDSKYFLHQSLSTPVINVLKKAQGIGIEDLQGRTCIDMHGNGVHNAGFNNPHVIAAVRKQLDDRMTFCPRRYTNIPAIRLAEKLARITPGDLARSLFCPGGSEAIEMALALAKHVTGNFRTISYWGAFHGAGFAAASVGGERHFTQGLGPMVSGACHVHFPDYYRNPWNFQNPGEVDAECLRQIELIFKRKGGVAALIGEPVSAAPAVPGKQYWSQLKALCDEYGALLIFDEIIEGLGRTGRMFAAEHFLTPDILVLGKSLGGGLLPLAGIVTHDKYNTCSQYSIGHYTHEKNALCAAAALAEIDYIEKQGLCENAAALGRYTIRRLRDMQPNHPLMGNVTGIGLHIGIDLVQNRKTKQPAPEQAEILMLKCMEKGLAFKTIHGNIITLRPALTITRPEMDRALDILEDTLTEVENHPQY